MVKQAIPITEKKEVKELSPFDAKIKRALELKDLESKIKTTHICVVLIGIYILIELLFSFIIGFIQGYTMSLGL